MSALDPISRRTLLSSVIGKVNTIKDDGNVQLAQVQISAAEIRDNTPVFHDFGFTSSAPAGSDYAMSFMGGDRGRGMVVGANHPQSRPRNLTPGQSRQYDQAGSYVWLTNDGNGTIFLSGTLTVQAPTAHFTGDVLVDGSIAATGSISSAVDVIAGPAGISEVHHVHEVVAVGAPTKPPQG